MRFYTFDQFLNESNIPLSSFLQDYSIEDKGQGKFKMVSADAVLDFSVLPLPNDMSKYEKLFFELERVTMSQIPSDMFKMASDIQNMSYKFGNVVPTSISLSNVKGLEMLLNDTQRASLKASPKDFLEKEFSSVSQSVKDYILKYLGDVCKKYGIVMESMFYYTRSGSTKQFYRGKNSATILKDYQHAIDLLNNMKSEGPYDSFDSNTDLLANSEYAYWKINKGTRNLVLRAVVSPEYLNSAENIGNRSGINFTILDSKGKDASDNFKNFAPEELERKIKKYFHEI